jgi:hypothetical protein
MRLRRFSGFSGKPGIESGNPVGLETRQTPLRIAGVGGSHWVKDGRLPEPSDGDCLSRHKHAAPLPPPSERRLAEGLRADAAELVLCLQVITELDEKKNDVRLSERAAGVIKSLDIIHEQGGSVRDGVKLNIFNQPVRYEEFREPLSPDNKDDRMVSVDRLSLVFDLGLRTG